MKRFLSLILAICLLISLSSCSPQKETLKIYNVGEYIDASVLTDFEKEYNCTVIYDEFNTNEEMYVKIANDDTAYDVVVPSDYTIDRLIQEDRLAKIDKNNVSNISEVSKSYLNPEYDKSNDYSIPYMVGTLGIIYNKKLTEKEIDSWSSLWDNNYKGKIFMWDSVRDAFTPPFVLNKVSINTEKNSDIENAKKMLIKQKPLVQAYIGDETKAKMVNGEGVAALLYSGDAYAAIQENNDLAYVVPKEGSNKWVDGFCILKNTKHKKLAEDFINFMCRPDIATRNMEETGYTSPVEKSWDEFDKDDKTMFPDDSILNRCEPFLYSKTLTEKLSKAWEEVKAK